MVSDSGPRPLKPLAAARRTVGRNDRSTPFGVYQPLRVLDSTPRYRTTVTVSAYQESTPPPPSINTDSVVGRCPETARPPPDTGRTERASIALTWRCQRPTDTPVAGGAVPSLWYWYIEPEIDAQSVCLELVYLLQEPNVTPPAFWASKAVAKERLVSTVQTGPFVEGSDVRL